MTDPRSTVATAARASMRRVVASGAEAYNRAAMLPRLIRATPSEIADRSASMQAAILRRLEAALAAERRRGRAGHWTYSLNRHIGLRQALEAERASAPTL